VSPDLVLPDVDNRGQVIDLSLILPLFSFHFSYISFQEKVYKAETLTIDEIKQVLDGKLVHQILYL